NPFFENPPPPSRPSPSDTIPPQRHATAGPHLNPAKSAIAVFKLALFSLVRAFPLPQQSSSSSSSEGWDSVCVDYFGVRFCIEQEGIKELAIRFFSTRLPLVQGSSFVYLTPTLVIINAEFQNLIEPDESLTSPAIPSDDGELALERTELGPTVIEVAPHTNSAQEHHEDFNDESDSNESS
ncbi:hypothetical protein PIB30_046769, partial [Stylosanthes scabra]|nr:hypothetical protein [Stylosanthes scabra]